MASYLTVSPLPMERNLLLTNSTRTPATIISLRMCHNFQEVKQLHAQFVVSGLLGYHPLCARRLLEAYATTSQIYYAVSIFERIHSPDVFVYNTMIRGLTTGKFLHDSLLLYKEFLFGYLVPDNYTYTFVLKACSHLKAPFEGSIHDAERVLGEFSEENTLAKNAMISGYLSEGRVDKARKMFDNMTARDAASWSALITGYTKNGMHTEALALFLDMMVSHILPNEATLRGTWAFENLMEIEPTSGDRYKLAGLMFANAGEKEEAAKIRKMIHEKEMKTTCGKTKRKRGHRFIVNLGHTASPSEFYGPT
ncbi:hypothetical protein SADUNF_Sadunf16G0309100 [Salix dunnii]|uniref:Pentatricopeptide repeat-containing protein n=1 Tax=Salix dunnii TaxID=1413687 RepID=A0A835MRR9_9ROSI|nr:hypothetical protein SADUNF_Sadunf16G0309100 [Salix dunnii]